MIRSRIILLKIPIIKKRHLINNKALIIIKKTTPTQQIKFTNKNVFFKSGDGTE